MTVGRFADQPVIAPNKLKVPRRSHRVKIGREGFLPSPRSRVDLEGSSMASAPINSCTPREARRQLPGLSKALSVHSHFAYLTASPNKVWLANTIAAIAICTTPSRPVHRPVDCVSWRRARGEREMHDERTSLRDHGRKNGSAAQSDRIIYTRERGLDLETSSAPRSGVFSELAKGPAELQRLLRRLGLLPEPRATPDALVALGLVSVQMDGIPTHPPAQICSLDRNSLIPWRLLRDGEPSGSSGLGPLD